MRMASVLLTEIVRTEKMTRTLVLLLLGLPVLCLGQATMITNQITRETLSLSLTNKYGDVLTNLTVSKVTSDGLLLEHKGGATKVRFEDLPIELREKYQPLAAEAALKDREAGRANAAWVAKTEKWMADEKREKQDRFWRESRDSARLIANAQMAAVRYVIKGKVMQRTSAGLLISSVGGDMTVVKEYHDSVWQPSHMARHVQPGCPIYDGICLLAGWRKELTVVDGDEVCVSSMMDGESSYTTVLGAGDTVRKFKAIE